jgi:hypothetical protein
MEKHPEFKDVLEPQIEKLQTILDGFSTLQGDPSLYLDELLY